MSEEYYLTAEKLDNLKEELRSLKTTKRAELSDRLKRAKELGDLSENSEYMEAREEQDKVEGRIIELEETIKNAVLITKGKSKGIVGIGSTVKVAKGTQEFNYTIVGANETNPEDGFISNESPLGQAFLGKKSGDEIIIDVPAGKLKYKVISVK